ncbi:MAG: VUT family protein [Proteobacteria bacterium]|nr:VUT family protein [Pseudomonadota bacterium]
MHIEIGDELRENWRLGTIRQASMAEDDAYKRGLEAGGGLRVFAPTRVEPQSTFAIALRAFRRSILPVFALLTAISAIVLFGDVAFRSLDPTFARWQITPVPGQWLNWGLILVPSSFLAVHLAARRYGLELALVQILVSWFLILSALAVGLVDTTIANVEITLPTLRYGLALMLALVVSQGVVAVVFDGMRCIRWWQAPLVSAIWGSLVFAILFYAAAFIGSSQPWFGYLLVHFAIMAAWSVLLLIPYWICRPLIRPLPGFAGY